MEHSIWYQALCIGLSVVVGMLALGVVYLAERLENNPWIHR